MKAFVFPGQGSQFPGMGRDLYDSSSEAKSLFAQADRVLGYNISEVMFDGTDEDLVATKVTQPAVFIHSYVSARCFSGFSPDMVAGHSLGEFSALAASEVLSFEDALRLVYARAMAMQKACDENPGTMLAVLGLPDTDVEQACHKTEEVVVPANYNCPGQVVISGSVEAVEVTKTALISAGARRVVPLNVGGAFHSPLMEPARLELAAAIDKVNFMRPKCPIYQNVDGMPHMDTYEIKSNLLLQLSSPVRWTAIVRNMMNDGADTFVELGPGNVLRGLIKKTVSGVEII